MPVKILLADKSITIQKVVEMLFSGRDYEVLCASDGEAALSEAERTAPAVVLVDVDLPRVDGYSFADRLRNIPALAQTPVILMMSRDDVYDSAKGKQVGIIDHIAKPFESQELIGKVKQAIAGASARPTEPVAPLQAAPPPRPAAPVPPPVAPSAAKPRPAAPVTPPAAAPPAAKPKTAAPTDIFGIIDEAPSLADLKQAAAPAVPEEEESVYEVEPEIEEVEAPLAREIPSALPVGAKAVEEMRAGMGLTGEQEEGEPEIVTFESFDLALGAAEQETPRTAQPTVSAAPRTEPLPVQPPTLSMSELRSMAEETIARMAKEAFAQLPPVQPPTLPESELRKMAEETLSRMAKDVFAQLPPVQPPQISSDMLKGVVEETVAKMAKDSFAKAPSPSTELSASDVWSVADEAVTKMAKDLFATMPSVQPPQVSDDRLKGMVEETVARMAKETLGTVPAAQLNALPESELRSMAEGTITKMAQDLFRDMPPVIPKISDETVRRGIEDAIRKIAQEVAKDVIERVAWEVIPQLAEHLITQEIERLKSEP